MKRKATGRNIANARVKVSANGALTVHDAVAFMPPKELKARIENVIEDMIQVDPKKASTE
jgi:hypothetical protein